MDSTIVSEKTIDLILSLKEKCQITDDKIRSSTALSPSEYHGIVSISDYEEVSATEFSCRMGLSISRGSRIIEKMINHGYLKRCSRDDDRRATLISLAQKGVALQKKIFSMKKACEEKINNNLTADELNQVREALRTLIRIL